MRDQGKRLLAVVEDVVAAIGEYADACSRPVRLDEQDDDLGPRHPTERYAFVKCHRCHDVEGDAVAEVDGEPTVEGREQTGDVDRGELEGDALSDPREKLGLLAQ